MMHKTTNPRHRLSTPPVPSAPLVYSPRRYLSFLGGHSRDSIRPCSLSLSLYFTYFLYSKHFTFCIQIYGISYPLNSPRSGIKKKREKGGQDESNALTRGEGPFRSETDRARLFPISLALLN